VEVTYKLSFIIEWIFALTTLVLALTAAFSKERLESGLRDFPRFRLRRRVRCPPTIHPDPCGYRACAIGLQGPVYVNPRDAVAPSLSA